MLKEKTVETPTAKSNQSPRQKSLAIDDLPIINETRASQIVTNVGDSLDIYPHTARKSIPTPRRKISFIEDSPVIHQPKYAFIIPHSEQGIAPSTRAWSGYGGNLYFNALTYKPLKIHTRSMSNQSKKYTYHPSKRQMGVFNIDALDEMGMYNKHIVEDTRWVKGLSAIGSLRLARTPAKEQRRTLERESSLAYGRSLSQFCTKNMMKPRTAPNLSINSRKSALYRSQNIEIYS